MGREVEIDYRFYHSNETLSKVDSQTFEYSYPLNGLLWISLDRPMFICYYPYIRIIF